MTHGSIGFLLNGRAVAMAAPPTERLSLALRERLGAREVKVGCDAGDCGACTVLLDGRPHCACLLPAARAEGRKVETLSGLTLPGDGMARLRASFHHHGAAQCGICTPGILVSAVALLREHPSPSADQVEQALGGVLCRCTGYRKIIDAVVGATCFAEPTPHLIPGGSVGVGVRRVDGMARILGQERYGDDVAPDDALWMRVVRSPHAHALFSLGLGDLDAWQAAHAGVTRVFTAADVPGNNRFGVIPGFIDQPVLAEDRVRFRGEAVAAIVGPGEVIRDLDLDDFPIVWEPMANLDDMESALNETAVQLHDDRPGNRLTAGWVAKGDVESALATAPVTVHGEFSTSYVEHAYVEPEAGMARRVGERLEVHTCTQAPHMNRDSLAEIMGLPVEAVRVVPTAVGGGFGSKLDLTVQPLLAMAAWHLDRPVRLALTRTESMMSSTKRHPARMTLRLGAERDGTLLALDFDGRFNTGAYASWGPTVANRVPVHAAGPYHLPHFRARSVAVLTNGPPSGAFRGFGVPQTAFAQETLFDELAETLGLDPLAFRLKNALDNGLATGTGQVFETGVGIKACLEALQPHWQRARAEATTRNLDAQGDRRTGVGIACGWYGCGNTSIANPSTIKAGIRADGAIVLHQGAVDIGQGSDTVITQMFADALGVDPHEISRIGPDTDLTPDAGKTSASRQTFISGNAARLCGARLRQRILRHGNVGEEARLELEGGMITLIAGEERRRLDLSTLAVDGEGYVLRAEETYDAPVAPLDENGQGAPYAQYGYAAHMVELEVDIRLGTVHLTRITAAHDVGKAINPVLASGQIEGGIAQGIGLALMEEYLPGRTENLHDYLIPTFGDVPPITTLLVEVADPHGPWGAKGLGEHTLIPAAPAICNAIRHATGARIRHLPATPSRVMEAIGRARREAVSP